MFLLQRCSNPQFQCTISFRSCDGLDATSLVRFTVYDVREKLSQTAVPLGTAEIALGHIQDTNRVRIALRSTNLQQNQTAAASTPGGGASSGFITLSTWSPEPADRSNKVATPARSPAKAHAALDDVAPVPTHRGHRRAQSLPPKLGVKLFFPPQAKLALFFANPSVSPRVRELMLIVVNIGCFLVSIDSYISFAFWPWR